MKSIVIAGLLPTLMLLAGCRTVITRAIAQYHAAADQVRIGDSREKVLAILLPTQEGLSDRQKKRPDSYLEDGKLVEIYYFRSLIQQPDILTDDEFTPYVFKDGKLVAIGWAALGGPKTQAYPRPETRIEVHGGYRW